MSSTYEASLKTVYLCALGASPAARPRFAAGVPLTDVELGSISESRLNEFFQLARQLAHLFCLRLLKRNLTAASLDFVN